MPQQPQSQQQRLPVVLPQQSSPRHLQGLQPNSVSPSVSVTSNNLFAVSPVHGGDPRMAQAPPRAVAIAPSQQMLGSKVPHFTGDASASQRGNLVPPGILQPQLVPSHLVPPQAVAQRAKMGAGVPPSQQQQQRVGSVVARPSSQQQRPSTAHPLGYPVGPSSMNPHAQRIFVVGASQNLSQQHGQQPQQHQMGQPSNYSNTSPLPVQQQRPSNAVSPTLSLHQQQQQQQQLMFPTRRSASSSVNPAQPQQQPNGVQGMRSSSSASNTQMQQQQQQQRPLTSVFRSFFSSDTPNQQQPQQQQQQVHRQQPEKHQQQQQQQQDPPLSLGGALNSTPFTSLNSSLQQLQKQSHQQQQQQQQLRPHINVPPSHEQPRPVANHPGQMQNASATRLASAIPSPGASTAPPPPAAAAAAAGDGTATALQVPSTVRLRDDIPEAGVAPPSAVHVTQDGEGPEKRSAETRRVLRFPNLALMDSDEDSSGVDMAIPTPQRLAAPPMQSPRPMTRQASTPPRATTPSELSQAKEESGGRRTPEMLSPVPIDPRDEESAAQLTTSTRLHHSLSEKYPPPQTRNSRPLTSPPKESTESVKPKANEGADSTDILSQTVSPTHSNNKKMLTKEKAVAKAPKRSTVTPLLPQTKSPDARQNVAVASKLKEAPSRPIANQSTSIRKHSQPPKLRLDTKKRAMEGSVSSLGSPTRSPSTSEAHGTANTSAEKKSPSIRSSSAKKDPSAKSADASSTSSSSSSRARSASAVSSLPHATHRGKLFPPRKNSSPRRPEHEKGPRHHANSRSRRNVTPHRTHQQTQRHQRSKSASGSDDSSKRELHRRLFRSRDVYALYNELRRQQEEMRRSRSHRWRSGEDTCLSAQSGASRDSRPWRHTSRHPTPVGPVSPLRRPLGFINVGGDVYRQARRTPFGGSDYEGSPRRAHKQRQPWWRSEPVEPPPWSRLAASFSPTRRLSLPPGGQHPYEVSNPHTRRDSAVQKAHEETSRTRAASLPLRENGTHRSGRSTNLSPRRATPRSAQTPKRANGKRQATPPHSPPPARVWRQTLTPTRRPNPAVPNGAARLDRHAVSRRCCSAGGAASTSTWLDEVMAAGLAGGDASPRVPIPVVDFRKDFRPRLDDPPNAKDIPPRVGKGRHFAPTTAKAESKAETRAGAETRTVQAPFCLPLEAYSTFRVRDPARPSAWAVAPTRRDLLADSPAARRRVRRAAANEGMRNGTSADAAEGETGPPPLLVEEVRLDEQRRPYVLIKEVPCGAEAMAAQKASVERLSRPRPVFVRPEEEEV